MPKRILNKFEEIANKNFLSIELGIQSLNNEQLIFLSRGHDSECSLRAINKIKKLSNVNLCVHLMFNIFSVDVYLKSPLPMHHWTATLKNDQKAHPPPHFAPLIGKGAGVTIEAAPH